MNILNFSWDITVQKPAKLFVTAAIALATASVLWAQTPAPSPAAQVSGVIGEVKAIDVASNQVMVRADNGVISSVGINDKTQYKRMAPGAKTLAGATDITV